MKDAPINCLNVGDDLARKIADARSGDSEAARWLLNEFVETVKQNRGRNGKPLRTPSGIHTQFQEPLLDYLAECLHPIANNLKGNNFKRLTADQALHLATRGKRGAKSSSTTKKKSLGRGNDAWVLYKKFSSRKDWPPYQARDPRLNPYLEKAIKQVAQEHKVAKNTVVRDYNVWRNLLKSLRTADT